jgi:hypothetical protein
MVKQAEILRVIQRTNRNEQWTTAAKRHFKNNIEALMVHLALDAVEVKNSRWENGPRRVTEHDVNAAFGAIWPDLYEGDEE